MRSHPLLLYSCITAEVGIVKPLMKQLKFRDLFFYQRINKKLSYGNLQGLKTNLVCLISIEYVSTPSYKDS